ncbi:hypothetical protein LOD99_6360 [Oopsacas minuta]|uniref:Transposase n=1 Tax=Oopsacas minuta TaxID=111878 RepID=A0AAV7JM53_9METZ|nr:hypothetical protein LOD99_6360 [Oopsacas minuta]
MAQLDKRNTIKLLLEANSHSSKEIAQIAHVSLSTVYYVKAKLAKGIDISHQKGAGRPCSLRNRIKQSISQQIRQKPYLSLRTLASRAPIPVSYQTVRRALVDSKYSKKYPTKVPMLSETNRLYRIQWAKKFKYPKKQWAKTVFADEMSIWLSRGRMKMWTKSDQKRFVPTTKHTPKINVWAAFSSIGTFPLCIFTTNMDSSLFIDILQGHLLTQAEVFHGNDWQLVMDNDPKHTATKVKNWLSTMLPKVLPWPSQSPDLNPIENLFAWVKQELTKQGPKTISELKKMLEITWSRLDSNFLEPYWSSMPRRCQMVIDSRGLPIKY